MNKLTYPIAAVFLAALAPLAHAGLEINYSIDGGATVTCGPDNTANNQSVTCPNVGGPPLSITILGASSNAPGNNPTKETSAAIDITNTTAGSHSIVINVISTGFMTPVAPPAISLLSHIGGTVLVGGANTLSFISCVNTANTQTGVCPASFNAPTLSPNITGVGSFQSDSSTLIGALASPYSIAERISLTLDGHSDINFSASTTLVQTPEPMSIALLGGILLLTGGAVRRKRIKQA